MNKFLEKYPQLRDPKIGDKVVPNKKTLYVIPFSIGTIIEITTDFNKEKVYHIEAGKIMYYRRKHQFTVVKYAE
jgi:hypothetical protein